MQKVEARLVPAEHGHTSPQIRCASSLPSLYLSLLILSIGCKSFEKA